MCCSRLGVRINKASCCNIRNIRGWRRNKREGNRLPRDARGDNGRTEATRRARDRRVAIRLGEAKQAQANVRDFTYTRRRHVASRPRSLNFGSSPPPRIPSTSRYTHPPPTRTMYKLIRRISSSFFPRPDRPWSEDATSTAPQIGRKRRLSTDEHEERETTPSAKKQRAESEVAPEEEREPSPARPGKETEEVKEVTKGVREVELEDGKASASKPVEGESQTETGAEEAAAVPLPESPELKPTEDTKEVETEAPTKEESKPEGSVTSEEATASTDVPEKSTAEESAPVPAVEDDVPGLTLPTQSEEKTPSTTAASSIPAAHTPATATDVAVAAQ
ncbi:hypothetical protein OH77DRAFT_179171 [Trametes cingulata]|nr:hypothetical protein OH77DRAFT_179171 [Trametes cingulata]